MVRQINSRLAPSRVYMDLGICMIDFVFGIVYLVFGKANLAASSTTSRLGASISLIKQRIADSIFEFWGDQSFLLSGILTVKKPKDKM